MARLAGSQGKYAPGGDTLPGAPEEQNTHRRRIITTTLWIIGLILLSAVAIFFHLNPKPWPIELDVTKALQGPHPIPCVYSFRTRSQLNDVVDFMNTMDDPIQSVALPVLWIVGMLLFRLFRQAVTFGLAVLGSGLLWQGIEMLVMRPRITPAAGVCVHRRIAAFSFPSGHVIHDTVFYGFLLYLSFTKPVREWRYHWALIPLQIAAVVYILGIGYSRLEAGEHLLFDVLGGYLTAALWLSLCIFVYHRVSDWLVQRHRGKVAIQ